MYYWVKKVLEKEKNSWARKKFVEQEKILANKKCYLDQNWWNYLGLESLTSIEPSK